MLRSLAIILILFSLSGNQTHSENEVRVLSPLPSSAHTGEKPQSKLWHHRDAWWAVLPDSSGTYVWRLDDDAWSRVLELSGRTDITADCLPLGDTTYVLLFSGSATELAVIEHDAPEGSRGTYRRVGINSGRYLIDLPESAETATIALDGDGRMWLATDADDAIEVRYSNPPFSRWSEPITLASGVGPDDIGAITALPDGSVGVLWSNQVTRRFGFKIHRPGSDPAAWSDDEVPADRSALDVGEGLSDDHLNFAVGSDGRLFAAVKTSYDTEGHTKIGLLVRREAGTWGPLYHVDFSGTRPIALLSEVNDRLMVLYTETDRGGDILYRETSTADIRFGEPKVFLHGSSLNNASSTKQNLVNEAVIVASTGQQVDGAAMLIRDPAPPAGVD